jgi:hypothetical protein
MVDKFGFSVSTALEVGTQIHTAPPAFGKVMSLVKPRMAVAYHFFNDPDTAPKILEGVRATYDGSSTLAEDYMVWNVTKDEIQQVFVDSVLGVQPASVVFPTSWSPRISSGRCRAKECPFRA